MLFLQRKAESPFRAASDVSLPSLSLERLRDDAKHAASRRLVPRLGLRRQHEVAHLERLLMQSGRASDLLDQRGRLPPALGVAPVALLDQRWTAGPVQARRSHGIAARDDLVANLEQVARSLAKSR